MEEISTIGEAIQTVTSGVESIDGQTGALTTKTINGEAILGEGNIATATTGDITSAVNAEAEARAQADGELQTAINGKQSALSTAQLSAVNSGIDSTKVAQIATNTGNISTINGKIPAEASTTNQLADKNFVNSSVATNTANYISDNGQPFSSVADLEAYSGTLTNNDYAFVVGTDSAGNTTYTRYKYNATTQEWAEEYVLNNSSFTSTQWSAINSGITSGDVTKLSGIESGAEVNDIDSISVNGTAVTPDEHKNVDITVPTYTAGTNVQISAQNEISATDTTYTAGTNVSISNENVISATDTTYSNFVGTDGSQAGTAGLVPAPATTDAGKFLKADGTWDTAGGGGVTPVQTTGTSTTDVMSQDATTKMIFPDITNNITAIGIGSQAPARQNSVGIGYMITMTGRGSVVIGAVAEGKGNYDTAIGYSSKCSSGTYALASGAYSEAKSSGSIALGSYSQATSVGEMNIGSTNTGFGYNSSNYRKITGVYDGDSAHDAATFGQLQNAIINGGTTAPTTTTVGTVGTLYSYVDTGNNNTPHLLICTDTTGGTYTWSQLI